MPKPRKSGRKYVFHQLVILEYVGEVFANNAKEAVALAEDMDITTKGEPDDRDTDPIVLLERDGVDIDDTDEHDWDMK